ncbi:large ribosomal subunit protein mL52 isoform X2 [Periplaneta americana]|uniref:large ribosomal subunit protein mL52 isoform X2 n=1 Tax=Periplaneta americana TaxID=6978 RepID=UPI0037E8D894
MALCFITTMATVILRHKFPLQNYLGKSKPLLKYAAVTITTSGKQCIDQKWRRERKLPSNPNTCGVLTDKPDYSYLDGRPSELGMGMKERLDKQREYAKTIFTLSKEMDFAVERHNKLMQEEKEERQRLLDSKLKRKGHLLLKHK